MTHGSAYDIEEKISKTNMVDQLLNSGESVMTVKFHKMVN